MLHPHAAGEAAEAGKGLGVQDEQGGGGHGQPFLQPFSGLPGPGPGRLTCANPVRIDHARTRTYRRQHGRVYGPLLCPSSV
ncbi:hypothetical protein GCM10027072_42970 [Streptomyces bullii]